MQTTFCPTLKVAQGGIHTLKKGKKSVQTQKKPTKRSKKQKNRSRRKAPRSRATAIRAVAPSAKNPITALKRYISSPLQSGVWAPTRDAVKPFRRMAE